MESLRKLETTVAEWYETIPHLPKASQRWIAQNVWWIVLVGVILSGIGIFWTLTLAVSAGALLTIFGGVIGAAIGGFAVIAVLVSLAVTIVNTVIAALAITPLKALRYKGWSLLFLTSVINVASLVLVFILSFNLGALIWGLLVTAIGLYFLFEVRSLFVEVKKKAKKE